MASKRKVNLDDYQLTTTLGTGKLIILIYLLTLIIRDNNYNHIK